MFTCLLLMSTCTCRRKSRGKLDLLSQKDSYHPMAEYLQYQSHGRYVSPSSKPNPYSQVRARGSPEGRAGDRQRWQGRTRVCGDTASGYVREGLGWILGKKFH
ncbi:Mucin-1 [Lonchura striata]|uniref:Mucin-1 n=1 Tax=Lonchura striata TaxID=40157 RepID=A0A218UNV7_9PASE|nr:Mucin-1 [Lonchura striata domestica]